MGIFSFASVLWDFEGLKVPSLVKRPTESVRFWGVTLLANAAGSSAETPSAFGADGAGDWFLVLWKNEAYEMGH